MVWAMEVSDLLEEVDSVLWQEQRSSDGMHWSITPSFVEEPSGLLQMLEVGLVGFASPEVHVGHFEVCPEVTQVVNGKSVVLVVLPHELEHVEVDVTVQLGAWLDSPVVLVVLHQLVVEEEPGLETTHVSVRDTGTVDDVLHVLSGLGSLIGVDPVWEGPVLLWNEPELGLTGHQAGHDGFEFNTEWLLVKENPISGTSNGNLSVDLEEEEKEENKELEESESEPEALTESPLEMKSAALSLEEEPEEDDGLVYVPDGAEGLELEKKVINPIIRRVNTANLTTLSLTLAILETRQ
ncbi:hypothetical protein WICPIJ_001535 [Wickerhamomyces pijperi]|uniref:Uncharacterized protein n=1 Tax=Wickerhamomyces pijperi TaxID=599730 RepID=A0A9P8QDB9_WICPI|nr:hypothetical protein WICPIJ_001535 [Wickerhamomyces pijperi]